MENRILYSSNKTYFIHDYTYGEDNLSFRAYENDITKIDIIFGGVKYLDIPTRLEGLQIRLANINEIFDLDIRQLNGGEVDTGVSRVFTILSKKAKYSIVLDGISIYQNDLDIFESVIRVEGNRRGILLHQF